MNNKQNNWYAVEIETATEAEEAVEFALNELDSLGNEINHLGKEPTENLTVIGYFNEKIDVEILCGKLNQSLRIFGFPNDAVKKIEWREVENKDWLAEWKKHWKVTETEKFIIAPIWQNVANTDKIIIRIEPSMAFGTGTHETTKLCLRAIEEFFSPGMSFFDVGTGTGILAIAAAKIKSKAEKTTTSDSIVQTRNSILACDTDDDSIKIAVENAEINKVNNIKFYVGSISNDTPKFDFVCVNVTADIIVPMLPLLIEKTNKKLILSGILTEQEISVTEKLNELQIVDFKIRKDGEWISVLVEIDRL